MTARNQQGIGMTSQRTRDRLVARLAERGITDHAVLGQMAKIPRHLFIDEALAHRAYEDTALPIGLGQTISQPFVVAAMTALLLARQPAKVLEIGSGCGYQTAILAGLCREVWSIERIPTLARRAEQNLRELKIRNVRIKAGDGYEGWPDRAPFDAIIVTAAAPQVPPRLLEQLAPGARMVIPVGGAAQSLWVIDNEPDGLVQSEHDAVRFVPLLPGVSA